MLRSLSIRNFVIVDRLELDFEPGFTVLTGETGAGKSILLDALDLLLGERFDTALLRAGEQRAELAAEFAIDRQPLLESWLNDHDLAAESGVLLVRRVLDVHGKSRSWVNGRPVTLQQLREAAESLVDIHGQHAHQSLLKADAQRALLDSFGGFAVLATETAGAWRRWRQALLAREHAAREAMALAAERDLLAVRHHDLLRLGVTELEWSELSRRQRRLANAAKLLAAAQAGEQALTEADGAVLQQLSGVLSRLRDAAIDDPVLGEAVELLEPAQIQVEEAARLLRAYQQRADLEPADLAEVELRLSAIHEVARKYRVRPEQLPQLAAATAARLAEVEAATDDDALASEERGARADYDALAEQLSAKRRFAASEFGHRVSTAMQSLAMPGGSFTVALHPLGEPAGGGAEQVEFQVSTHPQQPPGPLARVASGGELSRLSLAIQVVASEATAVPTLVFDEVDVGIGGGVAEVVGRLLQQLGLHRQVICVTHLPQVAACADHHCRVRKGDSTAVAATRIDLLDTAQRIEELARMMGGIEITGATRAHAQELLSSSGRRRPRQPRSPPAASA